MQREALTDLDRDSTRQRAEAGEIRAGMEQREQRAESKAKQPPSLESSGMILLEVTPLFDPFRDS